MCKNVSDAFFLTASSRSVHGRNMILLRLPPLSIQPHHFSISRDRDGGHSVSARIHHYVHNIVKRPQRCVPFEPKPRLRIATAGDRQKATDNSPWSYHSPATLDETTGRIDINASTKTARSSSRPSCKPAVNESGTQHSLVPGLCCASLRLG
jgi:hypothetical protein